jgi:hypothetical protein
MAKYAMFASVLATAGGLLFSSHLVGVMSWLSTPQAAFLPNSGSYPEFD